MGVQTARFGALLAALGAGVLAPLALGSLVLASLALGASAADASRTRGCSGFSERSLALAGLGSAFFAELRVEGDLAELYGGICLESEARLASGEPHWTVYGERASVDGRTEPARFVLEQAVLLLGDWQIEAAALVGEGGALSLSELRFRSVEVWGWAKAARYDLADGALSLSEAEIATARYHIFAARAELREGGLRLEQVVASPCRWDASQETPAAPPLRLSAARADLGADGGARLGAAVLGLGPLALPLGEGAVLVAQPLADIDLPISVGALEGLGLSALSRLRLGEALSLELGAVGLDGPAPAGVFLMSAAQPGLRASVGRARLGPQADVERTRALAPWLRAVYGLQNRHWAEADFLHEGFLRLEASSGALALFGDDRLELSLTATLAASSQRLAEASVISARSGLAFGTTYRAPPSALGQLAWSQQASYTSYPQARARQWGWRLRPSWSGRWGPLGASLDYELQLTDGGSPFSARLDKLAPASVLAFALVLEDAPSARLALAGRHDFLAPVPWRRLELSASGEAELAFGRLAARLALEAAGLLSPRYDPGVEAFAALDLSLVRAGWEFGAGGRYAFVSRGPGGLERLELSAAWPLRGPELELRPFVALELSGPLTGRGPLALSGHGAELEVATCCGLLTLGYRAHQGRVTTRLSLGVAPEETGAKNPEVETGAQNKAESRP